MTDCDFVELPFVEEKASRGQLNRSVGIISHTPGTATTFCYKSINNVDCSLFNHTLSFSFYFLTKPYFVSFTSNIALLKFRDLCS